MQNSSKFISAIASALELPSGYLLTREAMINDVPGWDSFAWISVVAALEEVTCSEFPIEAIDTVHTIDDLIRLTITSSPISDA